MKKLNYDEKLNIVLRALYEAKQVATEGHTTRLFIAEQNGLKDLIEDEITLLIRKLKDEEGIIDQFDIPTRLKPITSQQYEVLTPKKYYEVKFTESFDDWYAKYLIDQNSGLDYLHEDLFSQVYDVLLRVRE